MGGSDHCYILDAVATIDILTANNGKSYQILTLTFCMTIKSRSHF